MIKQNQVRLLVGRTDSEYITRLRNAGRIAGIPMVPVPHPLSRSDVFILAIGPWLEYKTEGDWGPQTARLKENCTADWTMIPRLCVKKVTASEGIDKILLFFGAKNNFRTKGKKKDRRTRAIKKRFFASSST